MLHSLKLMAQIPETPKKDDSAATLYCPTCAREVNDPSHLRRLLGRHLPRLRDATGNIGRPRHGLSRRPPLESIPIWELDAGTLSHDLAIQRLVLKCAINRARRPQERRLKARRLSETFRTARAPQKSAKRDSRIETKR